MITDGLMLLGVLMALACVLIVLEKTSGWKVFKYVPGMVFMYLSCALLNTLGLFGDGEAVRGPTGDVANVLLPAMIFLFLFECDLRKVWRLGPRLLLTYAVAVASLFGGMVLVYLLFKGLLHEESWRALSALLASWTGGSANMVAVQGVLQAPETIFGYALITDTTMYSLWLMVLFASVGLAPKFNRFTKADTSYLDLSDVTVKQDERPVTVNSLAITVFGSIFVAIMARWVGGLLPEYGDVINSTTWTILIVSVLGLIVAVTPMSTTAGARPVGTLMLYMVIGDIASGSDFAAITQAPLYILVGILVLLFHAFIMIGYAKLTKTDLFTVAVASAGNMGGLASAPAVAGAYSQQLIPVGVLFALLGSFLGTFIGLAGAQVMGAL
ncbi:DUF819 family protein [Ancrocorticia populi]|uniref:DUF819 family protein n=1 Tax=Ancrocorticia populi TaxID=2175228 RepID=UPI003F9CE5A4